MRGRRQHSALESKFELAAIVSVAYAFVSERDFETFI